MSFESFWCLFSFPTVLFSSLRDFSARDENGQSKMLSSAHKPSPRWGQRASSQLIGSSEVVDPWACSLGDGLSGWKLCLENLPKSFDEHMDSPSVQCGGERQVRGWVACWYGCYNLFPGILLSVHRPESYSSQFACCALWYIFFLSLMLLFLSILWCLSLLSRSN